jgi:dCMP deaminase
MGIRKRGGSCFDRAMDNEVTIAQHVVRRSLKVRFTSLTPRTAVRGCVSSTSWTETMLRRTELKDSVFLTIARDLATLSTCDRKYVGALIVRDGRCVSWGFNGAPPGLPHCVENLHGWSPERPQLVGEDVARAEAVNFPHACRNSTHAEANALAFAARQGISTDDSVLYVTVSPCLTCSGQLIAAGIRRVVYEEEYRDLSGLWLLKRAGVTIG